jgi:transcriptional regulator PpsR
MDQTPQKDNIKGFANAAPWLGDLSADQAASLVAASSDIAILLDSEGVVRDLALARTELDTSDVRRWLGRAWVDTVTVESRNKVYELLTEARDEGAAGLSRPREINHPAQEGGDIAVRYSAIRLNDDGRMIAIGRDLRPIAQLQQQIVRAQQAMEREYARLRAAETRYRTLFQMISEPVIVLDGVSGRTVEVNQAAQDKVFGRAGRSGPKDIFSLLDAGQAEMLRAHLAAAKMVGGAEPFPLSLAGGAGEFLVSASVYRQDAHPYVLLSLTPAGAAEAPSPFSHLALDVMDRMPDAFVLVRANYEIVDANRAFVELCQIGSKQQAIGAPLGDWLGRPGIDLPIINDALQQGRVLRPFPTVLRGQFGGVEEVEVSAVAGSSTADPVYGFVIRSTGARAGYSQDGTSILPRSVEQLTELIGRVPLKELVRETTDLIEKLCIESALALARDNRASAAQMLGLSRQSFYAKMRRYGLGNLDGQDDEG